MGAGAMTEAAQVGKRQELADWIWNIEAQATPFLSWLASGPRPKQMLAQWQAEVLPAAPSTSVPDGTAATSPRNVPRYLLQGYGHFFRQQYKVSTLADLTNVAGLGTNEIGHQRLHAMKLLKRQIEQQALSEDETAADNGTTGYTMRGVFKWLQNGEQAVLPVPSAIRPPSAVAYTGAFASWAEANFVAQMAAAHGAKKEPLSLTGFVGLDLKAQIDEWTIVYPTASTTSQPLVQYVQQGVNTRERMVDTIRLSTGTVDLVLAYFMAYTTSTGAAGTYSAKSGVFLDKKAWDLCWMKAPANTNLPLDGSGIAGYIDAVGIVRCKSPLGQCYVLPTS
jgi:hypothetical protein